MPNINNWIKGNLYGPEQKENEFIIFKNNKIDIPGTDTTFLEISFGCDGTNHAWTMHQIWEYQGKVEYANHINEQIVHKCNCSCIGEESKGFFIIEKNH